MSSLLLAVLAGGVPIDAQPAPAPVVTVEVGDYAFTKLPASVSAGWTRVRLVNRGKTLHHMQLNKLAEGRGVSDMLREFKPGSPLPTWMTGAGGPSAAWAGQSIEMLVNLEPGNYGVICWVPAADHQLHVQKGMIGKLTVVPRTTPDPVPAPRPTITIAAMDYNWTISAPVTRGRHVIRFDNKGPQPHELVVVRLAEGKSMVDAKDWAERGQTGSSPGVMLSGVAALTPGKSAYVTNDFGPGRYALLCFVPDQKDRVGHPHVHYGMMKEFTVQ
ncbi:MAG TPA: hypothetical protein VE861_07540 [Gemmatimonadaceae bacterium]|nr:hypothetical protein [Gemmatimonadaceae bacterium]